MTEALLKTRIPQLIARRGKREMDAVEKREVKSVDDWETISILLLSRTRPHVNENASALGTRQMHRQHTTSITLKPVKGVLLNTARTFRKPRNRTALLTITPPNG